MGQVGMSEPASIITTMTPTALLAFERDNPTHTPTKTAAIRHQLGISDIRYYVLLGRAARSTEGIAAHPLTARMVRERAEQRARMRRERAAA